MSKIPYKFFPIPTEFLTDDFINDPDMMRFIRWIFSRISLEKTTIPLKSNNKLLELEPFEFIYGRDKCVQELMISEKKIRGRLKTLIFLKYLEKRASKSSSNFTVYRLVTESFNKIQGQQKGQQKGQQVGHNLEDKKIRKKNHPPFPPSSVSPDSKMIDDFSFSENQEGKEPRQEQAAPSAIEVRPGVFLSQTDLDECIRAKGSLETVEKIIDNILGWPGRKFDITNWGPTIKAWNYTPKTASMHAADNEGLGNKLAEIYSEYASSGWKCEVYRDSVKDQMGLLFLNSNSHVKTIFVAFVDLDFQEKCKKLIREKKMQKARIPNS